MKWFKHISTAGNDPVLHDAITLFGSDAYYVFFRTLEIMSDHFDTKNPGKNSFSRSFLSKNYNISMKKVTEILQYFSDHSKIIMEITTENRLEVYSLNCPKLKDLTDEYTNKVIRSESGVTPDTDPDNVQKKSPINKKEKKKESISVHKGTDMRLLLSEDKSADQYPGVALKAARALSAKFPDCVVDMTGYREGMSMVRNGNGEPHYQELWGETGKKVLRILFEWQDRNELDI